ncbi:MAG: hypothetical protein PHF44_04590 [Candidatus Pacebacteria bacterium]|nr:hypothetical protein [Candidatus Paceibacterota bacterium]
MALEVKKQERETSQSVIRRFTEGVKRSGILVRARKLRFKQREKSSDMQKKAALRKIELKKEYEKMKKMGKLEDRRRYR